jgi:hypothetical protein
VCTNEFVCDDWGAAAALEEEEDESEDGDGMASSGGGRHESRQDMARERGREKKVEGVK